MVENNVGIIASKFRCPLTTIAHDVDRTLLNRDGLLRYEERALH